MLAPIGPTRPVLVGLLSVALAVTVLRFEVVWRIVVALVWAVVRMTSAGGIGSHRIERGRTACAGGITTGPGRACGAVGIAAGGDASVWGFPVPIGVISFSGMIIPAITPRMAVASVREDGRREEESNDQVDELHRDM